MDSTPPSPTAAAVSKLPLPERLKSLVFEYGGVGLAVFLGTFLLTISGVFLALTLGMNIGGTTSSAGTLATLVAAYVITLATKPLRIAATIAITPAVAVFLRRSRKPAPPAAPVESEPSAAGGQSEK